MLLLLQNEKKECVLGSSEEQQLQDTLLQHELLQRCTKCDLIFQSVWELQSHIETEHLMLDTSLNKPHGCPFCHYRTSQRSDLSKHIRTHTGERPYQCNFCPYRASQLSCVKRHERIHTGNKSFKCQFCTYMSNESASLQVHIHSKHRNLLY